MQIARTLAELTAIRRAHPGTLALVPTMGALHEGHLSLIRAARQAADHVSASIFVNPTQFNQSDDLARYPRDEAGDLALLESVGCDWVWLPEVDTMYPPGDATMIEVAGPAEGWEGAARPGHFRGVATVVAKLFGQVRPDVALFGAKDWQQLQVIRRMVTDLSLPVRVQAVPTARAPDGLALSSRNRFLTGAERQNAPALMAALEQTAAALRAGTPSDTALNAARDALSADGFGVEYLALVDSESLRPTEQTAGARLIVAARLGSVRLLDNLVVD